jgi:hypothetical protein
MKFIKIISAVIGVFCVSWISLISYPLHNNDFIQLLYNEEDHTLLIVNGESGKYICKVVIDLHQDTLFVNVYKKMAFRRNSIINSAITNWKIKLIPNVGFIKLGDVLMPLSEIRKYPEEDLIETYYPSIEVFPWKFPYVAK